jgi:hypothetical protein
MNRPEPVRVFAAAEDSQLVAARVLEYSIRKHTPRQVEFNTVRTVPDPASSSPERPGHTAGAVLLPQLTGFQGRALYLKGNTQVFADLSEIYDVPFNGHTMLCAHRAELPPRQRNDDCSHQPERQQAVMLVDYSRLLDHSQAAGGLEEDGRTTTEQTGDVYVVPANQVSERIPVQWNSLEHYNPDETRLVHYASVSTQPWKNDRNPLRELWMESFREALAADVIDPELVLEGIAAGHLDPGLRGELHHHRRWSQETDRLYRRLERMGTRLEAAKAKVARARAEAEKAKRSQRRAKKRLRRANKRLRRVERSLAWRGPAVAASAVRRALEIARTDSASSVARKGRPLKAKAERDPGDKSRKPI